LRAIRSTAAHHDLGDLLFARQDIDGAEAAYRAAIECDPELAEVHMNLGILLQSHWQDIDGRGGGLQGGHCSRPGVCRRHTTTWAPCSTPSARAPAGTAITRDPRHAHAHAHGGLGGLLWEERGSLAEAAALFLRMTELAPRVYDFLGGALKKQGDRAGAAAAFRCALASAGEPCGSGGEGDGGAAAGRGGRGRAAAAAADGGSKKCGGKKGEHMHK
jgi:tetratricopeptide (TPR) repeat protein